MNKLEQTQKILAQARLERAQLALAQKRVAEIIVKAEEELGALEAATALLGQSTGGGAASAPSSFARAAGEAAVASAFKKEF